METSLTPLLKDVPRGVPGKKEEKTPKALWADPKDLAAMRYDIQTGNRLLLGEIDGHCIGTDDNRHMLTIAGSRAGKGVSAIIPNLLTYRGSALVIDPKGENAKWTARRRAEDMRQKVFILDPFSVPLAAPLFQTGKFKRASFNPLSILTPDSETLVADAGLISDALVIASGSDAHWDDSARNLIQGIILHVATYPKYEKSRNLVTVRELVRQGTEVTDGVTPEKGMHVLYAEMQENDAADGVIAAAGAEMAERPDDEGGSVLSNARRHTQFLDMRQMQNVLRGHDFDLSRLKKEKITIYLCLPAYHLGRCSRWFRLFINLLLQALETEDKPDLPVLMILDEFAVLGHMKQIEDAAGQVAGFGVKLWPIVQDLGQIKALYGERWESFAANAGMWQCFGNNDVTTLEYISKRLGQTSIISTTAAQTGQDAKAWSTQQGLSWRVEVIDLMTPEEIARFFDRDDRQRRQLIIRAGKDPVIASRVIYYDDPRLKKLI